MPRHAAAMLALTACAAPTAVHAPPPAAALRVQTAGRDDGVHVTLAPSNITAIIPAANVYAGEDRLHLRSDCRREWTPEMVRVIDAALPFDRLAVELDDEEFCTGAMYTSMHTRLYVMPEPVAEVAAAIVRRGGPIADQLDRDRVPAPPVAEPMWTAVDLSYRRYYGDYGATQYLDFYLRRFADHTLVIVFMHAAPHHEDRDDDIRAVLRSVRGGRP